MRSTLLALCVLALAATSAKSGPEYYVDYWNGGADLGGVTSSTPIYSTRSYDLAPSFGSGTFTGAAHAGPGYVNSSGRVDCTWGGGFSGGFSGRVDAHTRTDDLIITGPASPSSINAILNLHVKVNLSHSGGYPDNNGHLAYLELAVNTLYSGTVSDLGSGNHSTYGTGVFAAVTSPDVDMIVPIPGNYPVNAPFTLQISTYVGGSAYGNADYNPGMVGTDAGGLYDPAGAGVSLGTVGGQIMTLPAGYDFSIPSWNIYDNTYLGPVAVGASPPPADVAFTIAGANPTRGDARFALTLPRAGVVRVRIYDAAGRHVRTLVDGWQDVGRREFAWDGRDAAGNSAVGVYFARAEAGGRSITRRVARTR